MPPGRIDCDQVNPGSGKMSHYACPVCTGPTSVVETRRSKKGLRRRRRCDNNHRFTTVEVPHDTGKRATSLIKWLTAKLDPEIADYALEEIRLIMTGTPEEPEEIDNEISQPPVATAICGPTGTHGQHPGSQGSEIASLENAAVLRSSSKIQQDGSPAPAHQVDPS